MNISIPSILFGLGGKCLLNWALVFLQRIHIWRSFVGVFSLSLAVADTALTLAVTTIYVHADGHFLYMGLQLTTYHVCLLVQILGHIYRVLHWSVVALAGLDHAFLVSQRLDLTAVQTTWIVYLFVAGLLWYLAVLYVFVLSDLSPVLDDVPHYQMHRCWMPHTSQIQDVLMVLVFFILGYIVWHGGRQTLRLSSSLNLKDQVINQSGIHSRIHFVLQVLHIFLNTWALFLVFLAVLILLPVGIPAYLGLNVAWLSFLNSLLIGVTLCVLHPAFELAQGLAAVPPDSFCEWKFKFSLATDDTT
ncbi:putative G-protein coupled receptor 160 [Sphaeramia orbicularis]|nr:probable G-protein coupled receptor 160 [Sphaeramia orbicularis]